MQFFSTAVTTLQTLVVALGAGLAVWGVVNLLEGWVSKLGGTHEINIGAGTLARPIEEVAATLLHEMVH